MRKPIPGFRFFECDECGRKWKSESRDCLSPSGEICENQDCESIEYGVLTSPYSYEERPEWPTNCGNLIAGIDYENYKEEDYDRNS